MGLFLSESQRSFNSLGKTSSTVFPMAPTLHSAMWLPTDGLAFEWTFCAVSSTFASLFSWSCSRARSTKLCWWWASKWQAMWFSSFLSPSECMLNLKTVWLLLKEWLLILSSIRKIYLKSQKTKIWSVSCGRPLVRLNSMTPQCVTVANLTQALKIWVSRLKQGWL